MFRFFRMMSLLSLLALVIVVPFALAQDNLTLSGSAQSIAALEAVAASLAEPITFTASATNDSAAFAAFCAQEVNAVIANRAISPTEDTNCLNTGLAYAEFLLAQRAVTLVVHPQFSTFTCLTANQLNTLLAPSATGRITNWNALQAEAGDLPLAVFLADSDAGFASYQRLDVQVSGDGLRSDIAQVDDVIAAVETTTNALGIVTYAEAQAAAGRVVPLALDFENGNGCVNADPESIEVKRYLLSSPLYLYTPTASVATWANLVTAFSQPEAFALLTESQLTGITASAATTNQATLAGEIVGRQFSLDAATFNIPFGVASQITIGGSPELFGYLQTVTSNLTGTYTDFTVTTSFEGELAGYRRFCNGEQSIIVSNRVPTEEESAACAANSITPLVFAVGTRAVVLLGNAADAFSECLTREQIRSLWAVSADAVMTWEAVDSALSEQPLTLFGITAGTIASDILLSSDDGVIVPVREDTELDADPLYRAAAVGNVSGALTYMTWQDYQRVLANNQQNVQLVSVNDGEGCIVPTEASILDGSYSLQRPVNMIVSQKALADAGTQSYLWSFFSDATYANLASESIVNEGFIGLPSVRNRLLAEFALAQSAAASATAAEATPEAAAEVTPEATPQN